MKVQRLRLHRKKESNAKDLRAGGAGGVQAGEEETRPLVCKMQGKPAPRVGALASHSQHIVHPSRPPSLTGARKGRLSVLIHGRKWLPCDPESADLGSSF